MEEEIYYVLDFPDENGGRATVGDYPTLQKALNDITSLAKYHHTTPEQVLIKEIKKTVKTLKLTEINEQEMSTNKTITREQFTSAFNKIFGDNWDKLFDKIVEGFTTTNYKCFFYNETVYIVDLYNEELITWYKLGHVGRALKITKEDATVEYIEEVFKEIKNELNI